MEDARTLQVCTRSQTAQKSNHKSILNCDAEEKKEAPPDACVRSFSVKKKSAKLRVEKRFLQYKEEEKSMKICIMDGRARFDIDESIVISCCDSLEEAMMEMREDYRGYDYVVVDLENNEILNDPWSDGWRRKRNKQREKK
jgi:hypothetical protein